MGAWAVRDMNEAIEAFHAMTDKSETGLKPDISRYAAAAGVSAAELQKLVEKDMSMERGALR
jgi:hypothetical protein